MAKDDDVLFEELNTRRTELREKLSGLRHKISKAKKGRDEKNRLVVESKKKRNDASSKIVEIKKKLSELNCLVNDAPSESYSQLKREYDSLNWQYQTEVMGRKSEERVVKRLDELEHMVGKAKNFQSHKKDYNELIRQLKDLKTDSKTQHELVLKNAAESEAFHTELVKLYDLSDKAKADLEMVEKRIAEEFPGEVPKPRKKAESSKEMKDMARALMEDFRGGKKKLTLEDLAILQQHEL